MLFFETKYAELRLSDNGYKASNTPYHDENVARNMRKMRRVRSSTQELMAAKLGISMAAYSKIETGIMDVNLSRLEQVSAILAVPLAQLFARDEPNAIQDLPPSEYFESSKRIESYEVGYQTCNGK